MGEDWSPPTSGSQFPLSATLISPCFTGVNVKMKRCYSEPWGWRQREECRRWSALGSSASAATGESNAWCWRCNLQCWWQWIKKKRANRNAEVNLVPDKRAEGLPGLSWRAPLAAQVACECISAAWEGAECLFLSLPHSRSLFSKRETDDRSVLLQGCRLTPAVISGDIERNNPTTNHSGSS